MKILITGTAGFIGFHLSRILVNEGHEVFGLDSINDYYDQNLKFARLKNNGFDKNKIEYNKPFKSEKYKNHSFINLELEDVDNLQSLCKKEKFVEILQI